MKNKTKLYIFYLCIIIKIILKSCNFDASNPSKCIVILHTLSMHFKLHVICHHIKNAMNITDLLLDLEMKFGGDEIGGDSLFF